MSVWHASGGTGGDLVLLHGWGMNAAVWEPLLPALELRWRVTRIELPGHGESAASASGLEAWVDALLAAAPAKAIWLGWSLGGLLALAAAARAPERINQLCLLAATPCFVQNADWSSAMPAQTFSQFAEQLSADVQGTVKRFLGLQVRGSEEARPLLRQLGDAMAQRPAASTAALADGLALLQNTDLRAELAGLTVPVSALLGERDTLVPSTLADALTELNPAVQVSVQAGAAHAPFLSHPEGFLAWLEQACGV